MAKVIMVQGTASNAGKSLLAAALCRIFRQDGYSAAPFKSQNMALNSYTTADGYEMSRAQAMQAEAAGIEPSPLMNPILLKPTSDTGSQVIVNGRLRETMRAADYFKYRGELRSEIMEAFDALASQYDVLVIEGAGSPAEINLKRDDIVNMGMAKMADAPVLLVGDIDRGGVFASLYGTVALLEEEEQARIKGLIINKFRGDPEILRPGLVTLEELTKKPVLGVIPYMELDIDDEDSLSERLVRRGTVGLIDIAVIRLPRMTNFTDFNPLERMDEVSLRYVSSLTDLGSPDLIVLPGTEDLLGDTRWMRESGFEAAVLKHASKDGMLLCIRGGIEILDGIKGAEGYAEGTVWKYDAHGVFEQSENADALINALRVRKGLDASSSSVDWDTYKQQQYDKLAEGVRGGLDMGRVYAIMGLEGPAK